MLLLLYLKDKVTDINVCSKTDYSYPWMSIKFVSNNQFTKHKNEKIKIRKTNHTNYTQNIHALRVNKYILVDIYDEIHGGKKIIFSKRFSDFLKRII